MEHVDTPFFSVYPVAKIVRSLASFHVLDKVPEMAYALLRYRKRVAGDV